MFNIDTFHTLISCLNKSNVEYCLIEIEGLEGDCSFYVPNKDAKMFKLLMINLGFHAKYSNTDKFQFIYKLEPDVFWENNEGMIVYSAAQMSCRSLSNLGMYKLPLDKNIQEAIWTCKEWDVSNEVWRIGKEEYCIYLLVKCIFDLGVFDEYMIERLSEIEYVLDNASLKNKLSGVFFSFSDSLIHLLKAHDYNRIIHEYRTFIAY